MKLLAIDGNSIMNRAFYGIKMLSNKNGVYTNALTGFMNIYLKICAEQNPDGVACAFDLRAPTFRHKADSNYKANRHGMPDELAQQMPMIKRLLKGLGVHVLETEGFEADDILGTLSDACAKNGDECVILTGDRDSLQLINDKVTVLLHGTRETTVFTPEKFHEVYGLEPKQLIDLKGLMGDSSDNISGVKGIGEKTALTLIGEYGSVENLYEKLENNEVKATNSVLTKLSNGKEDAFHSKWLATIVFDAPVDKDPKAYLTGKVDENDVSELLTELEMYKLLEKLGIKPSANVPKIEKHEEVKKREFSSADFAEIDFDKAENAAFILEESGLLRIECGGKLCTADAKEEQLKFFSSDCKKYGFQVKNAFKLCFANDTELKNLDADADILGYLLNASSAEYTIEKMCAEYGRNWSNSFLAV